VAADGRVQLLPVEHVACHQPGTPGRTCELADVTQEERQFDVLV
jgi:hypothetical protein